MVKRFESNKKKDLRNIRIHLEMLKQISLPVSTLCAKLIHRLEESLQGVHSPELTNEISAELIDRGNSNSEYSWDIFNQCSLQQFDFSAWK